MPLYNACSAKIEHKQHHYTCNRVVPHDKQMRHKVRWLDSVIHKKLTETFRSCCAYISWLKFHTEKKHLTHTQTHLTFCYFGVMMHYTTIMVSTVQWDIITTHISWTNFIPVACGSYPSHKQVMQWTGAWTTRVQHQKRLFLLFLSELLTALPLLRYWSL